MFECCSDCLVSTHRRARSLRTAWTSGGFRLLKRAGERPSSCLFLSNSCSLSLALIISLSLIISFFLIPSLSLPLPLSLSLFLSLSLSPPPPPPLLLLPPPFSPSLFFSLLSHSAFHQSTDSSLLLLSNPHQPSLVAPYLSCHPPPLNLSLTQVSNT